MKQEITDIFLWANNIDAVKQQLQVELFLFNKNYTPYSTNFSSDLNAQIKPLFLYDMINYVNLGAGTGLSIRDFELGDDGENILQRTEVEKVGRAETLIHLIEKERHDIVEFSQEEHEFKRIKGIVARFTDPSGANAPFYIIKAIPQAQTLSGATTWEFSNGSFGMFQADVGIKMPADNQVLITGSDIFAFNPSKFEKLFNYEFRKLSVVEKKVDEIEKHYKLSFPDGLDLSTLVGERKKAINKLQHMEIGRLTQEQVLAYADDMQVELMADDNGAIIIMDGNDLDTFLNLINEDYITTEVTGIRYEVKSKRMIDKEDEL